MVNDRILYPLHPCFHLPLPRICQRTKKFGPFMKCLLILLVPIPIAIWTVVGITGSAIMGIAYGYVWPVLETFKAISREGESLAMKLLRVFTDDTWNNIWGACTIVRDFADFHSIPTFLLWMSCLIQGERNVSNSSIIHHNSYSAALCIFLLFRFIINSLYLP